MANIVITRSRRGLFNEEEWETFSPNGSDGPDDTRVYFRCRNSACYRIWTMQQAAYKVLDIEENPIQCSECGSYDITATWCNTTERPYTLIGIADDDDTGTAQQDWLTDVWRENQTTLKDFRTENDGRDPVEDGTASGEAAAWNAFQFFMNYIWIDYPPDENSSYPYDTNQYFEVFHRDLPAKVNNDAFWAATDEATTFKAIKKTIDGEDTYYYPSTNDNFYRCIINMVIQTEVTSDTGGTGGSGE